MSNIAKRIAATVVLGLFTAGTPALAAETEVQIGQGVPQVQFDQGEVGQMGDAAAPAAVAGPAPMTLGTWRNIGTYSCPGGHWCKMWPSCFTDETAVSGMCGDAGSATDIRLIYSGRDPGVNYRWICYVTNGNLFSSRTVNYGVYCVK